MKKNKQKIDKELFKGLLLLVLGGIVVGGTISTFLLYALSSILSFKLSLPIQIILGFLIGGGATGLAIGASIKDSLKNGNYEEEIIYEEYELDDEGIYEDEFERKKTPSLRIVKGSGSNYGYKFNDSERSKLEIVNPDNKRTSKKR